MAVFTEPVDKWRNLNGNNLLQLMYEAPERHSYTFQSYAQLTMAQLHMAKTNKPMKIIERSVWSGRHVFAENLLHSGKMAPSEFEVLNAWFEFLKASNRVDLGVDLIVYLRTSPLVAYQRLKSRARSEEKIVSLNYLQDLHDLHEKWLLDNPVPDSLGGAKVLVVDANKDISTVPQVYSEHECSILDALRKHQNNLSLTLSPIRAGKPLGDLSNCI